jgi:hypothetical protein
MGIEGTGGGGWCGCWCDIGGESGVHGPQEITTQTIHRSCAFVTSLKPKPKPFLNHTHIHIFSATRSPTRGLRRRNSPPLICGTRLLPAVGRIHVLSLIYTPLSTYPYRPSFPHVYIPPFLLLLPSPVEDPAWQALTTVLNLPVSARL